MMVQIWLYLAISIRFLQVHSADPCESYLTCKECVRAVPWCKWCSSDSYENNQRCVSVTTALTECPSDDIKSPKGSVDSIGYDREFSDVTQIKPQRFKIKLRPGETQTFDFSFKASPNFPADLYFLFDSSTTMTEVLITTAKATKAIYNNIKARTKDVLIGMGTFVDKNAAPFVRVKDPLNPISSFNHKLNMTADINNFEELVNDLAANTKQNYDLPEGGFDALAQAITCKIGWRDMSRRIIFFFTDAPSHTAGDGKFAGIIYPYDGECYTDKNGIYTKELVMDYPSIGMISELAQKEEVIIIFLVEKSVKDSYKKIAEHIHGSQVIPFQRTRTNDIIFEDKDSLRKTLSKIYKSITTTIKFDTIMTPEDKKNIKISFDPDCTDSKNNPSCKVPIEKDAVKHFRGNITLSKYYDKDNIILNIRVGNGVKEKLILDIDVVDCECKGEEQKSSNCSGHGTKKCGVCECEENRTGRKCECIKNDNDNTTTIDDSSCIQGHRDKLPCNGYGYCECGFCKCNEGREGNFCECVKDNCIDKCNGHGTCYCGKCECESAWNGDDSCSCSTEPCKMVNGKICNGRGRCHCGSCKCDERAAWDARVNQNRGTCEMEPCNNCHDEQCMKLEDCARCRSNNENDCSTTCGDIQVELVEYLNATSNDTICDNVKVEIGCYTRLSYEYDDVNYKINLLVQSGKNCLESYYLWGGSILATLVLAGLLTLAAWKVLSEMRDRREYRRFLKQHYADRDESCLNPIYESATTTIRNPAFRKPSVDFT